VRLKVKFNTRHRDSRGAAQSRSVSFSFSWNLTLDETSSLTGNPPVRYSIQSRMLGNKVWIRLDNPLIEGLNKRFPVHRQTARQAKYG
jgi:hypothetical protein